MSGLQLTTTCCNDMDMSLSFCSCSAELLVWVSLLELTADVEIRQFPGAMVNHHARARLPTRHMCCLGLHKNTHTHPTILFILSVQKVGSSCLEDWVGRGMVL